MLCVVAAEHAFVRNVRELHRLAVSKISEIRYWMFSDNMVKVKIKGKVLPRTGHEGPEVQLSRCL
jgi:hypothetical protein